ncbi:hypothetical protein CCOS865_05515 [Pseudomonas reidholzensis]|uniref:Uncharacterized protein n=1 Tax=Pseudomonas reidholzensis TaxID=1785162 RepID=A0A383S3F9_9PSED|nr:hypothetical protein CCOS865_05515 [Pseudomonas reidholzensis]
MVQGNHQDMLLCGQTNQPHSQQRAMFQVERSLRLGFHLRAQNDIVALLECFHSQFESVRGIYQLDRLLIIETERGAQRLMAVDEGLKASLQGGDIQRSLELQGGGDVVGRTRRFPLPQEPLPLLGIGKRKRLKVAVDQRDRQLRKAHSFRGQLLEEKLTLRQGQPDEALYQFQISVIHLHLKLPQARS